MDAKLAVADKKAEKFVRKIENAARRRYWRRFSGRYHSMNVDQVKELSEELSIPFTVLVLDYGFGYGAIPVCYLDQAFADESRGESIGIVLHPA